MWCLKCVFIANYYYKQMCIHHVFTILHNGDEECFFLIFIATVPILLARTLHFYFFLTQIVFRFFSSALFTHMSFLYLRIECKNGTHDSRDGHKMNPRTLILYYYSLYMTADHSLLALDTYV